MNPSLRKAAILISALDTAAADQLLDQMGEQQAARVRSAVLDLDDVEPAEQDAILADFFGKPARTEAAHEGVELNLSMAVQSAPAGNEIRNDSGTRFEFLEHAASGELARGLRHEHPQLIALVVAHLSAEKAAEFLEHFPRELRHDVLDRLVDLD